MNFSRSARALAVLAVFAVLTAFAVGCGHGEKDDQKAARPDPGPIPVTVAAAERRAVTRTVSIVGTLYGQEEVSLSPKVEGRVRRVLKDVGDVVKPGDVLLEIDPKDLELAAIEAERALDIELARLSVEKLTDGAFDFEKVPAVRRAHFTSENARRLLERAKKLGANGGVVSRDELDKLETECNCAISAKQEQVAIAKAALASAQRMQASLTMTRQRLSDCQLRAPQPQSADAKYPAEYVVAGRMASEGEMVRAFPSTNVFRLVMDRPLKLKATVPERHSADVKVGQTVQIEVEAHSGRKFTGTIARLNPTVDADTRTFQVEATIANEDRALRAGSFAKGRVETRSETVLTVPPEAIVSFAGVTKVFAVVDGKAKAVLVTTGQTGADWVEVRGDLGQGAKVATSGLTQLVDGSTIRER